MKKTLLYILAATTAITIGTGCRKTYNDTIQGQTPDQRVAAALAAYQKKLTSAPYGWVFIESNTGTAYNQGVSQTGPKIVLSYFMQFTDSGRVSMISDFDPTMAGSAKTSSYEVKQLTRPALIFDTYSYLHVPCDPDPNISHSPYGFGYGWGTDFEFSFSDSVGADKLGDTIHLIGNLNSAQGTLVKATQAQHDAYLAGNVLNLMAQAQNLNNILQYFKRLSIGGFSYDIRLDAANRTVTFTWVDGSGNIQTVTVEYYISGSRIQFVTPIVNGSQTITGIDGLSWDASTSTLTATIGSQTGTITGAAAPVKADMTAGSRWYNYAVNNALYWATGYGFHVNGVDDAYGVRNLTDANGGTFYYYIYFPNFFPNPADAFGPVMLDGNRLVLPTGTAPQAPLFLSNGTTVFKQLGSFGTIPPGGPIDKSNTTLYNAAGFYFVQRDEKDYDMVLATDAKTWISWFWPQ